MAATTMATAAMLNAKCLTNSPKASAFKPNTQKPISLQNLPKSLTTTPQLTGAAIAATVFSTLSSCDSAFAAQQIAELAEGSDNRGTLLLIVITPAIAWVLFNILQPALNQLNKMRSKGVIVGLGLGGGLAASGLLLPQHAAALGSEIASIAAEAGSDNRGQLLLFVITPAIAWVLYNILQPALNQINKMRS